MFTLRRLIFHLTGEVVAGIPQGNIPRPLCFPVPIIRLYTLYVKLGSL